MKLIHLFRQNNILIIKVSIIFLSIFFNMPLNAQNPVNFSGRWEYDKLTSSPTTIESKYDGTVYLQITQDSYTIRFGETWVKPGNEDFETAIDSLSMDGVERTRKSEIGTSKRSAKWSKDFKVLRINNLDTQKLKGVLQNFFVSDSYSLTDDGLILTMERYAKNPVTGETTAKKVYRKK